MNLGKSLKPLYLGLAAVALAATVACNGSAAPAPAVSTPTPVPAASVAPRPGPTPSVSAKFAGMLLGCDDGQANYSVDVQNIGTVPAAVYYRLLVGGQTGNWATTPELGSLQPGQRATLLPTIEHYVRGTPVSMQFGFNNITGYPVVTFSGIENNLELRCNTPTLVTIPTATATAVPPISTPTPTPTATAVPQTVTPVQPTATATATATPGPTLEERAQSIVDKYRNDTTTTITDYSQIQPIVDAVLKDSGLKYDNLIPQIWAPERFNKWYCNDKPECIQNLNNDKITGLAATSGKFVIIREGQFFQVITVALREILLNIGDINYNAKSTLAAEIAGNLGSSFVNHTMAQKFGYDPFNNVADTPENRKMAKVVFTGSPGWVRSAWLINEAEGYLDRAKPEKQLTAAQALASYKSFVTRQDPDKYAIDLGANHNLQEDSAWVTQALQLRFKKDKAPSIMDAILLNSPRFYMP